MKILAPFDTVEEASILIREGADELYCGLNSDDWLERGIFPNARHMFYGNLGGPQALKAALNIAKKDDVPVFLCANDYLPEKAFRFLLNDISYAIEMGIDGVIIADISLATFIKRKNADCKVILSCLNPCFNSLSLEFFKEAGIDRVVLPMNQMTLEEIRDILPEASRLSMELEIFINNVVCRNVVGFCLNQDFKENLIYKNLNQRFLKIGLSTLHVASKIIPPTLKGRIERYFFTSKTHSSFCRNVFELEKFEASEKGFIQKGKLKNYSLDRDFAYDYCGLCGIYFLVMFHFSSLER